MGLELLFGEELVGKLTVVLGLLLGKLVDLLATLFAPGREQFFRSFLEHSGLEVCPGLATGVTLKL